MNVLSLFDGISVGRLALKMEGIKVDKYFASEIDKYANQVTMKHFPETIQLGDVTKIDVSTLPKINLLLGGSPCQGFSFAGKGLDFDDPRSALFFEFVRIKNELTERNPDLLFLLENVKMKTECENVISDCMGVYPVEINSALVSAQQRKRLYWTNIRTRPFGWFGHLISDIPQPADRHIYLKDIIENGYTEKDKTHCIQAQQGHTSESSPDRYLRKHSRQIIFKSQRVAEKYYLSAAAKKRISRRAGTFSSPQVNPEKTGTLNTKNNSGELSCDNGTTLLLFDENGELACQKKSGAPKLSDVPGAPDLPLLCDTEGNPKENQRKINALMAGGNGSGNHNNMDILFEMGGKRNEPVGIGFHGGQGEKFVSVNGKSLCIDSSHSGRENLITQNGDFRRLTPLECERAQTYPDNYTAGLSDRQRYKCTGNGWTLAAIAHIFSFMEDKWLK